jgi:O-antigen/teichoic acid export membrane protein
MEHDAGPAGTSQPLHVTREPQVRGLATVGSDVAAVSGARIAALVAGACTVVLTTRLLGPAGYAQIAYAVVLGTLVSTASSAWTAAALTRYGREELERDGTIRRSSWARILVTLPLLVTASALVAVVSATGLLPGEIDGTIVALAICSGLFLTSSEHLVVVLEAAGRMRLSALGLLLRAALVVATIGALALVGADLTPETVIAVTAVAGAMLTLGLAPSVWRLALWPPYLDRATLKRMLVFSVPLIAFAASQYGMRSVDIVVLGAFRPHDAVGIYAAAFQAFVMLTQLTTTLTIVLVPLFVSIRHAGRTADLAGYLSRTLPQLTLLMGLGVALAAPFAAILVPVVLGDAYADAVDPLVVLLGALLLQGVASLAAPVLMLYERTRATAVINLAALVVNIAGDLLLVGALGAGVVGPAVASGIATAVIAGGYLVVSSRLLGVRARLPLVVALAPSIAIAAAVALPAGAALAVAVAGAVAGVAASAAVGVFSRADLARIRLGREPRTLSARLFD